MTSDLESGALGITLCCVLDIGFSSHAVGLSLIAIGREQLGELFLFAFAILHPPLFLYGIFAAPWARAVPGSMGDGATDDAPVDWIVIGIASGETIMAPPTGNAIIATAQLSPSVAWLRPLVDCGAVALATSQTPYGPKVRCCTCCVCCSLLDSSCGALRGLPLELWRACSDRHMLAPQGWITALFSTEPINLQRLELVPLSGPQAV